MGNHQTSSARIYPKDLPPKKLCCPTPLGPTQNISRCKKVHGFSLSIRSNLEAKSRVVTCILCLGDCICLRHLLIDLNRFHGSGLKRVSCFIDFSRFKVFFSNFSKSPMKEGLQFDDFRSKKKVMEFLQYESSNRNPLSKGAMKLREMGDGDDHQVEMFHSAHGFSSGLRFMLGLGMQSIHVTSNAFVAAVPAQPRKTTSQNTGLSNPLPILIPVAILTHMVVSCWTSQQAVGVSSTSSMLSLFFLSFWTDPLFKKMPVLQPCLEMTPANDANA